MSAKAQQYLELSNRTARELTRYWENWADYLTTASRLYKYRYPDQLMIYAQRPDATACASYDIWNDRMNRYVRRGSKGIALLDTSGVFPRLHYVFDVADTGTRRTSLDPDFWQVTADTREPVAQMLREEYGISNPNFGQQLADLSGKLVDDYWDNNRRDVLDIVDGSMLEEYGELNLELQFKSAAAPTHFSTTGIIIRCLLAPYMCTFSHYLNSLCNRRKRFDFYG